MLFSLIKYRCSCQNTVADEQQCDPQNKVTVVAGLRRLRIVLIWFIRCGAAVIRFAGRCFAAALRGFDFKLRAALTVIINNGQGVLADRKSAEVIFFQRDNRRAGHGSVFICVDELAIDLNAGEL